MAQWYVNELSKLTKVSVRTLHHYDQTGLLKPSRRLPNGYRLYSEADLLKLQQIIALKFFGFELSKIKFLLDKEVDILAHLEAQSRVLQEKSQRLLEASKTLNEIISDCGGNESIPWEKVIKLIGVYTMTQELEKSWAGQVLSPDELKEYADFQQSLKSRSNEKVTFEKEWTNLVRQIEDNLNKDPISDFGIEIAKRCMKMVNGIYGKKHAALKAAVWEKGFKGGHTDLSPEVVSWLDKAMDTYYRRRIYGVLSLVETESADKVLKLWNELMEEMYGDAESLKQALYEAALKDDKVNQAAKNWLKKILRS